MGEERKYCRLLKPVRDREGRIRFRETPLILQEVCNIGRVMYLVRFHDGNTMFLFPEEIEVLGRHRAERWALRLLKLIKRPSSSKAYVKSNKSNPNDASLSGSFSDRNLVAVTLPKRAQGGQADFERKGVANRRHLTGWTDRGKCSDLIMGWLLVARWTSEYEYARSLLFSPHSSSHEIIRGKTRGLWYN
jgi:hypothetical protein